MNASRWQKGLILGAVTLGVIVATVAFAILHHDDGDPRIDFALIDQNGTPVSHENLAGQYLLAFFGFTSCREVCPIQMTKLSGVMAKLDNAGLSDQVRPVFISVDPERDNPGQVKAYLQNFHEDFIGLTGSRPALDSAAKRFKTYLEDPPREPTPGYQIAHSSVVYVVDPFSRLVDYVPLERSTDDMSQHIQSLIQAKRL